MRARSETSFPFQFFGVKVQTTVLLKQAKICIAAACMFSIGDILVSITSPGFSDSYPFVGEVVIALSVLVFASLGLASYYKPEVFLNNRASILSIILFVVSVAIVMLAIDANNLPVLALGAFLRAIATAWLIVLVVSALSTCGQKEILIIVPLALILHYGISFIVFTLPFIWGRVVYALFPVMIFLLVRPFLGEVLRAENDASSSLKMSVGEFLASRVSVYAFYILVCAFSFMSGLIMALSVQVQTSIDSLWAAIPVPVLAIAIVIALFFGRVKLETIFIISASFVIIGLLLIRFPFGDMPLASPDVVNLFLGAGVDLFEVLVITVLSITVSKYRHVVVLSVALYSVAYSVGILMGSLAGNTLYSLSEVHVLVATLIIAGFTFLFILCVIKAVQLVPFRDMSNGENFSFNKKSSVDDLVQRSSKIAKQYDLTDREAEVLQLLARGRNSEFIGKEMVISLNTAKTHVKRVYAKTGVHSQQELLDLLDNIKK